MYSRDRNFIEISYQMLDIRNLFIENENLILFYSIIWWPVELKYKM